MGRALGSRYVETHSRSLLSRGQEEQPLVAAEATPWLPALHSLPGTHTLCQLSSKGISREPTQGNSLCYGHRGDPAQELSTWLLSGAHSVRATLLSPGHIPLHFISPPPRTRKLMLSVS